MPLAIRGSYTSLHMGREIRWYTLGGTSADAAFTAAAMNRLSKRISEALPGLKLCARELTADLVEDVLPTLHAGNLRGVVEAILDSGERAGVRRHVTVYCPDPGHPAARAARGRLQHAAWGISMSGTLSLTYARGNPYALWHETLHLLGAEDHYDLRTFHTTCGLPTCLMQYAPDEKTVGPQPFICPATATVLRTACG
jgi:hypothetical protein